MSRAAHCAHIADWDTFHEEHRFKSMKTSAHMHVVKVPHAKHVLQGICTSKWKYNKDVSPKEHVKH